MLHSCNSQHVQIQIPHKYTTMQKQVISLWVKPTMCESYQATTSTASFEEPHVFDGTLFT